MLVNSIQLILIVIFVMHSTLQLIDFWVILSHSKVYYSHFVIVFEVPPILWVVSLIQWHPHNGNLPIFSNPLLIDFLQWVTFTSISIDHSKSHYLFVILNFIFTIIPILKSIDWIWVTINWFHFYLQSWFLRWFQLKPSIVRVACFIY